MHRTASTNKQFTIKYITRGERYLKGSAILLSSFLLAFIFASIFTPVENSDALTCTDGSDSNSTGTTGQICRSASSVMNVQVNNPYYVTVSSSAGSGSGVALDYTSSSGNKLGDVIAASDTVTTTSNTGRPKYLYISTTSSSNDLTNSNTDLSNDKTYISAGGGNSISTASALDGNTWGFALPSGTSGLPSSNTFDSSYSTVTAESKFTKVPTLGNDILIQGEVGTESTDETTGEGTGEYVSTADIYYGTLATSALNAGTYSNTVLYTAFTTEPPATPTMQEFTTAECNALTQADSDNYDSVKLTLRDSRDDKTYTVARMKDGNCWMTANLALDGMDAVTGEVRTLTPEDSNVTTSRTLATNISSGTASNDTDIQIYSGDATKTTTDCGSYVYCITSDAPYGNYYNWIAATAGVGAAETTGTVFESVCPKGWRLPDNDTTSGLKSYSNLVYTYGLPAVNSNNDSAVQTIQKPPLSFPLAGLYYNGSAASQGYRAYYWSRMPVLDTANRAYHLFFGYFNSVSDYFYPQNTNLKSYGFSVRCVFEGDQIQNNMFMQDVNLTMCNNLAESTTSADNRRTVVDGRDNKTYRISHLADGNCWMVQNLALDGNRDLFPGSSNVTAKRTLNPNISSGTAMTTDRDYIFSGIASNYTSSCASSNTSCVTSTEPYGNLYNWISATATVGNATTSITIYESICPSGWRLPDNGTASSVKTYANLAAAYKLPTDNTSGGGNIAAVQTIQKSPLYFPLAGNFYNAATHETGTSGYAWSRTTVSDTPNKAYHLSYNSYWNNFYVQDGQNGDKSYGYPVRCVLGE